MLVNASVSAMWPSSWGFRGGPWRCASKTPSGGRSSAEIQRVRLDKAKHLLAETEWPLAKVAESVGCTDASYLHQIFKRSSA